MKLFAFVALTMVAFAANSVLNRLAVAHFGLDPMMFAALRVTAGAVTLWLLLRGKSPQWSTRGALALAIYMLGFSWAYLSLDTGVGALILFGTIQIVMFGWALVVGQNIPTGRWIGAAIAGAGLAVLLWPSGDAVIAPLGALAMIAAGFGWAGYTLLGRGAPDALAATAGNFILCLPLVAGGLFFGGQGVMSASGVALAVLAGTVTSGLGYALWYRVLPQLSVTVAAVAQLSVPVIAVAAGVVVLGEPLTARLLMAGLLVLGGIVVSLTRGLKPTLPQDRL